MRRFFITTQWPRIYSFEEGFETYLFWDLCADRESDSVAKLMDSCGSPGTSSGRLTRGDFCTLETTPGFMEIKPDKVGEFLAARPRTVSYDADFLFENPALLQFLIPRSFTYEVCRANRLARSYMEAFGLPLPKPPPPPPTNHRIGVPKGKLP